MIFKEVTIRRPRCVWNSSGTSQFWNKSNVICCTVFDFHGHSWPVDVDDILAARWTAFSQEFQSIIARIHAKNNENLSVLAASSSRELRHVNTRKHSMTSQDSHLEYQRDPNQRRLWPGFGTLSCLLERFHVFGRQHKRYLLIFLDSKRQTERFKRTLRSLNINQRKTMVTRFGH